MKFEGKPEGVLDVKRFYIPGLTIKDDCSKCGKEQERDMKMNYLSYPVLGKPSYVCFYCEDCDHDWSKDVVLEISLKAVT